MITLYPSHPDHSHAHWQGWICSMAAHAIMGACALVLVSNLRMPLEPEQFQWNVALVEPSKQQSQADARPEIQPEAKPKPIPHTPQPAPPQPIPETVPQVAQPREVHTARTTSPITTVNQTASTIVPLHNEAHETMTPVTAVESVEQEEQPVPTNVTVAEEIVMPAVTEPEVSREAVEPLAQHAAIEPPSEPATRSQQPAVEQMIAQTAPVKADYGWLVKALLGRIDQLKNYPRMARINRWEGKVILRAVIRDDGHVLMVDVQESSGRSILDNDAIETLRKASPLKLEQPLGKPQVAILMPINYAIR
jgi:periplasmic protein TonB